MKAPLVLGVVAALALAAPASAQSVFPVHLTGDQVQSPVSTPNSGTGRLRFDPVTHLIHYDVTITGVTGTLVSVVLDASHPVVLNWDPIFPLSGGPTHFSGQLGPLPSPVVEASFLAGFHHLVVRSTGFPNGEMRGRVTTLDKSGTAVLDGMQVVPPTPSQGRGIAKVSIHDDNHLGYSLEVSGLTSPPTHAQLRWSPPGGNGNILANLNPFVGNFVNGETAPLPGWVIAELRAGRVYFNVNSVNFPTGEVRGAIEPSPLKYGAGCGTVITPFPIPLPLNLSVSGTPIAGEKVTLTVASIFPVMGFLAVGAAAADVSFGAGCTLLVSGFPQLIPVAMPQDVTLPATLAPQYLAMQFFTLDAQGTIIASNGVQVKTF